MTSDLPLPVLNLAAYCFVDIDDVDDCVASMRGACESRSLLGTVLVAPEGVNLFLAGRAEDVDAFVAWFRDDPRFANASVKLSRSERVPFGRLLVKRKQEIISFRQPGLHPAQQRAPSVEPDVLHRWLAQGHDDAGREVVLIDTRNQQEFVYGSFAAAIRLPIVKFTELGQALEPHRAALKDKTVVSFCTGGIRCEKAALWMRDAGYGDVLQLEGGILNYFERVGGAHYEGACFVFDERIALTPSLLPIESSNEA